MLQHLRVHSDSTDLDNSEWFDSLGQKEIAKATVTVGLGVFDVKFSTLGRFGVFGAKISR